MASENTFLKIQGGQPLNGAVTISGAKNAILPLMAGAVLTDKPVVFKNVPGIKDVFSMRNLLASYEIAAEIIENFDKTEVRIQAKNPRPVSDDPRISGEFRASISLLGPLLARLGHAKVYLPGGDAIDSRGRPIDIHITNLRSLGATVKENRSANPPYVEAFAPSGLKAPRQVLLLPKVSVGATQTTIMAACVASGTTTIENASVNPEVLDLIEFLKSLGANIDVDKARRKIMIRGKNIASYCLPSFHGEVSGYTVNHTVIPDRIEAGTYAIAAVITGGSIELKMPHASDELILELLESEFWRLLAAGTEVVRTSQGVIRISRKRDPRTGALVPISPVCVVTKPYPGFPTDMHPQWAALMCFSNGHSWIKETIFDDRFNYVEQLRIMGANISRDTRDRKKVNIIGDPRLQQLPQATVTVEASDIRAGAALILAALARNGVTRITGLHHVERGYENFANKFQSFGSQMTVYQY